MTDSDHSNSLPSQPVAGELSRAPNGGTVYRTCPDFPDVCKEYPGECRAAKKEPGSAEFRRIANDD